MKNVYFLLYCNFEGNPFEIGFGPESKSDDFFRKFRDTYGYDKYGNSDDEDCIMDMVVLTFEEKSELIQTIAESMGIILVVGEQKTAEQIQKEKIERAESYFAHKKLHKF